MHLILSQNNLIFRKAQGDLRCYWSLQLLTVSQKLCLEPYPALLPPATPLANRCFQLAHASASSAVLRIQDVRRRPGGG
jgi:hypothetical protein